MPWWARWALAVAGVGSVAAAPASASTQQPPAATAQLTVTVTDTSGAAVPTARVYAGGADSARVDGAGRATLTLPVGMWAIWASSMGFAPAVRRVMVARDTAIVIVLRGAPVRDEAANRIPAVVVRDASAIDEGALRVESIGADEIAEKVAMTPGDLTMLLHEAPGVAMRPSALALGASGPRILGLRARYTLVLADGLPQFGAGFAGITPLQVPPLDIARVEFIKGATSALYGPYALGGVVNLVSQRPAADARTVLVNATSRGGLDALGLDHRRWRPGLAHAVLVGVHRQERQDLDGDAWADIPGHLRAVFRPRLWWDHGAWSVFGTAGATVEDRAGGFAGGDERAVEALETTRIDFGATARRVTSRGLWQLKGAAVHRREGHRFAGLPETDRHRTLFAEASYTQALALSGSVVVGASAQHERYANDVSPIVDRAEGLAAVFTQATFGAGQRVEVAAATRVDALEGRGIYMTWRGAVLARLGGGVGARLTLATGIATPQVAVEGVDAIGVRPVAAPPDLGVERSRTALVDLDVPGFGVEWSLTAHLTRVVDPVVEIDARTAVPRILLVNAPRPTAVGGAELRAAHRRSLRGAELGTVDVRASAGFLRAREWGGEDQAMRELPLTARTTGSVVAAWEVGPWRIATEWYHVGSQPLDDDPAFKRSPSYRLWGVLVQRGWRDATAFVNGENLGNVRQTRWAPLPRSTPGLGGRRSVEGWAPLDGRVVNAGVRFPLG